MLILSQTQVFWDAKTGCRIQRPPHCFEHSSSGALSVFKPHVMLSIIYKKRALIHEIYCYIRRTKQVDFRSKESAFHLFLEHNKSII